ncbi:hypothetical protein AAC387_Pa01g0545 [Persea americana]
MHVSFTHFRTKISPPCCECLQSMSRSSIRQLVLDGFYAEALFSYTRFHAFGFFPHNFTFPSLLKACAKRKSPSQAQTIHAHILKMGFLHTDIYTATALTDAYMKLHLLEDAVKVFDNIPQRNLASLNAVISGFSQNGCFKEALGAFKMVEIGGFQPNSVTLASVLPACEIAEQGLLMHGLAIKLGHEMDVYVGTAALTMYCNCGELGSAVRVFELIPEKNLVSYNALISGLLTNGCPHMVLDLFKRMRGESFWEKPSSVTWVSLLSTCSVLSALQLGRQIHCFMLKNEVDVDVHIGTALVDMYSKCGSLSCAYQIFLALSEKNIVTWNSIISGMLLHGHCENAVYLFHQLKSEGLDPDITTWNLMISGFSQLGNAVEAFRFFKKMQLAGGVNPTLKSITSLLTACSATADLQHGMEIHGYTVRTSTENDAFIVTALVDMYVKCGFSCWARRIFDQVAKKFDDPALWNAMIAGHGLNGETQSAVEIFGQTQEAGITPNSATFVSVLSACSHAGWVEKGQELFNTMSTDYGINPNAEHLACMVDLLSRAGHLNEACDLIHKIPEPPASVFSSLLGASRCHSNAKLGQKAAEKLLELEPNNPSVFVILSNIYAEQRRWGEVESVREIMKDRGLKKVPGYSWMGARAEIT